MALALLGGAGAGCSFVVDFDEARLRRDVPDASPRDATSLDAEDVIEEALFPDAPPVDRAEGSTDVGDGSADVRDGGDATDTAVADTTADGDTADARDATGDADARDASDALDAGDVTDASLAEAAVDAALDATDDGGEGGGD